MDAVSELGPMLVFDLDFPDDDDFGMMSGGRLYPMSADAAGALAAGAMMLEYPGEVSIRLAGGQLDSWEREHRWKHYRRIAPSGAYLRWDGRVVPSRRQTERERGEWPPPDRDVGGWWPLADGTPTLAEVLAELNVCRAQAGLKPVATWSRD
jgi:hypothetical protein